MQLSVDEELSTHDGSLTTCFPAYSIISSYSRKSDKRAKNIPIMFRQPFIMQFFWSNLKHDEKFERIKKLFLWNSTLSRLNSCANHRTMECPLLCDLLPHDHMNMPASTSCSRLCCELNEIFCGGWRRNARQTAIPDSEMLQSCFMFGCGFMVYLSTEKR